ncbi:MAG: exodeoxyribonuclease VII large subunit [Cyanobacteria bacterium P01_A01_bin.105]
MPLSLVDLQQQALSVAGLTDYLQLLLEGDERLQNIWVVGEVSSARNHASGCFFALQEPDGSAQISCVTWRSQLPKLSVQPTVGEQVIVLGQIRLYPKRGSYQLTVWQVLPGGEGLKALRYQQLRRRLLDEGLFDSERKRPLPRHVETLAVVTSAQAAAWGDIQRTLLQRRPGLRVLLSPAIVQGAQAPASMVQAMERVAEDGRAQVLLLGRGGGAVEDLECFDDERVVRAIATCPIPVITGIGHQRDEALADLVADACAHTPTAAAEAVVASLADDFAVQYDAAQRLVQLLSRRLYQAQQTHRQLESRLQRLRLDRYLDQQQQQLGWQQTRLVQLLAQRLQQTQAQHTLLREKLAALDPEAVLRRGYALVRQESGAIVHRADELAVGERVTLRLGQGQATAEIRSVHTNLEEENDA